MTTTTDTDTTTFAAGSISWTNYPSASGSYSTDEYISISGTANSVNGVYYSASDLPDGITLDYTNGLIFGTPSTPGSWNSTITAYDNSDPSIFATASLSFDIVGGSGGMNYSDGDSFAFTTTPYPPATLILDNSITPIYLYTSGGTGIVTYTATGLPSGLFISAGKISGTPDTQTFTSISATITATDENGNTTSTSLNFPQVDNNDAGGGDGNGPTWSTYVYGPTTLKVNEVMADMFLDATGAGIITFTATNLPSGLYVDGSYIKGTPTFQTFASISVMIKATDSNGSQTKYVTFPKVNSSGGGGGPTWTTVTAPTTLTEGSPMSSYDFIFIYYWGWINIL